MEFVTTDIKDYSDTSKYLQDKFKEYSYNLISRHDTRSLEYDEHGNVVNGKMDKLAWFMGKISKLIDRMPSAIGNSMKKDLEYFLLHGEEIKSLFVDDKGLTTLGKGMVAAAAIAVLLNPIGTVAIAAKVIVTAVAVAYSLIISEEFFDMRIWNKKYLQEKWYGRLLLSPIQAVAFSLAGSVLDAGIGFLNKVTGVFEEVQELDDSFAKFLNTKANELNAVAELLD
ncbi:hypothetical protein [Anaerocolumna jejuensis]|uniref:hypothetical protein n=1 Tax=Anaerocolumna jejuensis TaxID=259063 RepID=UPI003F7B6793